MEKFTLMAVAKNERSFLKEWAFYHKMICGFDEIVVYNNDSDDSSEIVLDDLASNDWFRWIDWPRDKYGPPQATSYLHALNSAKKDGGWLMTMDLDEFLFLKEDSDIKTFVSGFGDEVGSISFNWVMFYSIDELTSEEPVTRSIKCVYEESGHVKTIVRTRAARVPCIHAFRLAPGFKYMHCSGFDYEIDLSELQSKNMSLDASLCVRRPHVDCRRAQINHYQIKSKEHCLMRDKRGCAATNNFKNKRSTLFYEKLLSKSFHKKSEEIENKIKANSFNLYEFLSED